MFAEIQKKNKKKFFTDILKLRNSDERNRERAYIQGGGWKSRH
jgi:hypothetical protein